MKALPIFIAVELAPPGGGGVVLGDGFPDI